MGMNRPTNLDPQLQVMMWDRKLRKPTQTYDPITGLGGVYNATRGTVPNGTYFELTGIQDKDTGARFARVPLRMNLSGAPREGNAMNQTGFEEAPRYKFFTAYYNDVSHAVNMQYYGIESKTKEFYDEMSEITPSLSLYAQELVGKYVREAYVHRYSANLIQPPHNLIQEFNPNVAVCGLAPANWPAFNMAPAAWANAIGTSLMAAAPAGTFPQAASASVRFLQAFNEWASTQRLIEPLEIGGKQTIVLLMPTPQCRWMRDPGIANNLGGIFRNVAQGSPDVMAYPGAIGRIDERLLIVEDPRYVTLTVGGSAGNFSLTPQYKWPGEDAWSDPRDFSASAVQVCIAMGKGGICDWNPEKWHFNYHTEEYDKFGGKRISCSRGWQLVEYDFGTVPSAPTSATRYHNGSALLLMRQPPNVT